jgi:heat shock protein HslJ
MCRLTTGTALRNLIVTIASLVLTALEANAATDTERWWVNSAKKDCIGVAPTSCFEIQRGEVIDPRGWQLFYDPIKGFDYEPGNLYRIEVRITDREPPLPADVSSQLYELVSVLSKDVDAGLRLTNLWKVASVGDIEAPRNKHDQPLVFEFDASARTYAGDMGCNRVQGSIAENDGEALILDAGMATLIACDDMTVEQAVSAALRQTRRYQWIDRRLRFYNDEGKELMTFTPGD